MSHSIFQLDVDVMKIRTRLILSFQLLEASCYCGHCCKNKDAMTESIDGFIFISRFCSVGECAVLEKVNPKIT